MRKSELVKRLQEEIEKDGDLYLLRHEVVDEVHGSATFMLSPTRTTKSGQRSKMNLKEFKVWCEDQRKSK